MIKIAINGFGRIGRCILRALYENNYTDKLEIVAINDLGRDMAIHSHLTSFDSIHGKFNAKVTHDENHLIINDKKIRFFNERDPSLLPLKDLDVDVVLECTGVFASKEKALSHIKAGAKKVVISAPADNVDATIVFGVNDKILTKEMQIISNASCTTNCLAPVASVLNNIAGIETGLMTTIHSYTNDQVLTDSYHSDIYRARSATLSMIPTKTGAAKAVGLVLPELKGKLDGLAIRVPTPNVSLVDLTITTLKEVTREEINQAMLEAASHSLKGVLMVNQAPLVSIDYNHNSHSSIFDATQTRVSGRLVKVFSWYDNEWGFSNRMLDTTIALMNTTK